MAAFADDLGGTLAGLNVPPGFRTTTIESKTNIFRACLPGRLTGVAVPVHVGIAVGAFNDANFPPPVLSIYEESKHGWVAFAHDLPHFAKRPT